MHLHERRSSACSIKKFESRNRLLMKNPVAKFCRKFNKGRIFRDRKKEAKKRGYYNKSEKHYRDGDNT